MARAGCLLTSYWPHGLMAAQTLARARPQAACKATGEASDHGCSRHRAPPQEKEIKLMIVLTLIL
eukprot:scaffold130079_cov26-Tisochrysis_lutea.AAC.2